MNDKLSKDMTSPEVWGEPYVNWFRETDHELQELEKRIDEAYALIANLAVMHTENQERVARLEQAVTTLWDFMFDDGEGGLSEPLPWRDLD